MVLELRPAHDPRKAYGFVGVVVSVEDLSASVWLWHRDGAEWAIKKVIEIPAEPAEADQLPELLKGFGAVPPLVTDINLSLDDQQPVRLVLGHRRLHPVRRVRSLQPEGDGARPAGRDRLARAASGLGEPADRRPADGRGVA